jgi:glyoxylase-like metal-dependent hydrolase (beta-lactamase superfamily II)
MLGTLTTLTCGEVKFHSYTSPEDGLLTNAVVVEGPSQLVVFDAQFFLPNAREAAACARALGKPVERFVLSHIHLNHWSGLGVLRQQFPGTAIHAPAGVAEYLRARGQTILDARRPHSEIASLRRPPSRPWFWRDEPSESTG